MAKIFGWGKKLAAQNSSKKTADKLNLRVEMLEDRSVPAGLDGVSTDDKPDTGTDDQVVESAPPPTGEADPGVGSGGSQQTPGGATDVGNPTIDGWVPVGGGVGNDVPGLPPNPPSTPTVPTTKPAQGSDPVLQMLYNNAQPKAQPIDSWKLTAFLPQSSPLVDAVTANLDKLKKTNGNAGQGTTTQSQGQGTKKSTTALIVVSETEPNDDAASANPIPLGTGGVGGTDQDVDVNGEIQANGDLDFYAVTLRAGDILGAVVQSNGSGLDSTIGIFDPANVQRYFNNDDLGFLTPDPVGVKAPESPLPTPGDPLDAAAQITAHVDGVYIISVGSNDNQSTGTYTLQLRVRRPVMESAPPGEVQKLFLDFNGGTAPADTFGTGGPVTFSPLSTFLANWGLTAQDEDAVIDAIVAQVQSRFDATRIGGAQPGNNVNYDFQILNSRDNPDTFGTDPFVSRVFVGGTASELGIVTIGLAQYVDHTNFSTDDSAVVLLDFLSAPAGDPNSLNSIPLGGGATIIDLIGVAVGNIVAHEIGHYAGLQHTINTNAVPNLIDTGGDLGNIIGLGNDGVFGTNDDIEVFHAQDQFEPGEGNTGLEDTANIISWAFSSLGLVTSDTNIVAIDVSRSMNALGGIDVNTDGVVDLEDDFNRDGEYGTLLDVAAQQAIELEGTSNAVIIFGYDARPLYMTPDGQLIALGGIDSDGNGETDYVETVRSIRVGEGGYFSSVEVREQPTFYEGVLRTLLELAAPDSVVTIISDGSGRLPNNSPSLQALADAGIRVNTIALGPYQTVAPIDDFLRISAATNGGVRLLPNLPGRPRDGGFVPNANGTFGQTVFGGGNPGSGAGNFGQGAGSGQGGSGSGSGSGSGGSGENGGNSGSGSGSGSGGSGGSGSGSGGSSGGGSSGGGSSGGGDSGGASSGGDVVVDNGGGGDDPGIGDNLDGGGGSDLDLGSGATV